MPAPTLNLEELKTQTTPLTPEQEEAIAQEAMKEFELEQETPEQRKKREDEEVAATKAQEEKQVELKERAKAAGLEETASEEEIQTKEDELHQQNLLERAKKLNLSDDTSEEEIEKKELAERAKVVGLEETASLEEIEAKEKEVPVQEDKEAEVIKALMESEKVSEEQAKEILVKDKATSEKFGNDSIKLARGYRNLQSRATKAEEQAKQYEYTLKQLEDQQISNVNMTADVIKQKIVNGQFKDNKGNVRSEGEIVEAFRRQYPTLSREKEDDECLTMAAEKIKEAWNEGIQNIQRQNASQATEKRRELLSNLSDNDKEFEPVIKNMLEKSSDSQVLSPVFDLKDIIQWAKGAKFDDLNAQIKQKEQEAYERGLKKGQEEAKILGERTPAPQVQRGARKTSSLARELNTAEQQRARDMFDHLDVSDREKFKLYIEVYPEPEEGIKKIKK